MTTEPKRYNAENPLKILSLGWGVQSWTLAAMAALGEIPMPDYAVHADTTHEMQGTYSHAEKWTPWLEEHGVKVITVQNPKPEVIREDWAGGILMPAYAKQHETGELGIARRQCTNHWKIQPIRQFIRTLIDKPRPASVEMQMGISLDEWHRMKDADVKYIKNVFPLVDQRISRKDCITWLEQHGLDVPTKSGCVFCPYNTIARWKQIKSQGGIDWMEAVDADSKIRHARPGYDYFVHSKAIPLEEAVRIPEDYGAKQMEMDIPCDSGHCFV
jgi:hypothetical protein